MKHVHRPLLRSRKKRVITFPASQLAHGSVQVRLNDSDKIVWIEARNLQAFTKPQYLDPGPEFNEAIRRIMDNFQEQNPMTFEKWKEGFRCNAHPEKEIGYLMKASAVFRHHATTMRAPDQRAKLYHLVGCSLNSGREHLPKIFEGKYLPKAKVEAVLDSFFGPSRGQLFWICARKWPATAILSAPQPSHRYPVPTSTSSCDASRPPR